MEKQNPFATPHKKNPSGNIKLEPLDGSQEKREFQITQLLDKSAQKQQQPMNHQKSVSFIDLQSSDSVNDGSKTQRLPLVDQKEAFMETMGQILNDRLNNKPPQKKASLSPFGRNSVLQSSITTQNISKVSIKTLRPQNSLEPIKSKSRNSQAPMTNRNQTMTQDYLQKSTLQDQTSINPNQQFSDESQIKIDEDHEENIDIDTFIEDTFIFNIQKFQKLKKKLIECTKEYRQYTFTHSSKRHHSRIIDSLGLNPLEKLSKRRPRVTKDPNIVYLDIDCSDKYGGARDIIEVKVNKSPPLLLNTRQQAHYELQYSNYTGLLSSLNERGLGLTSGQMMLNKLNHQISTSNALQSTKDKITKLMRLNRTNLSEGMKPIQPITVPHRSQMDPVIPSLGQTPRMDSTFQQQHSQSQTLPPEDNLLQSSIDSGGYLGEGVNIINDRALYDFGFSDSDKSYLQTLEEFSQRISNYDRFRPNGKEGGTFYDIQSEILNKAYQIDQGKNLVDQTKLQKLLVQLIPNYSQCLMRLIKLLPLTGCLMHQMLSFLIYQLDRVTRVFMTKENSYLDTIEKLEDQCRQMKNQLNATKEITQSYKKLEQDYHKLSELYSKRIEQSHEVAEMLSKDINTLELNFRNTSSMQVDSQDELQRKLETLISQFTMDRQQDSIRIAELKMFLDKNIAMLKNNWDDKRHVETQTEKLEEDDLVVVSPSKSLKESESQTKLVNIWNVVNDYIRHHKLKEKFQIEDEMDSYQEMLRTTEDIFKLSITLRPTSDFTQYQLGLINHFLDQADHTSQDYIKQAVTKIADYTLLLNHFSLRGGFVSVSSPLRYIFDFRSTFEFLDQEKALAVDDSKIQCFFETSYLAFSHSMTSQKSFRALFPIGNLGLYENYDKQTESLQQCQKCHGFNAVQIQYLFTKLLYKDELDTKSKEDGIQLIQKFQLLQLMQNQPSFIPKDPLSPECEFEEMAPHLKAMHLFIAQIEANNDTILDKRIWLMTLVKSLIKKDKATCFSYDNLVGNMRDGEVGRKLRSQIFAEFFEKHDIDRDFYDTFYSPGIDAVFLENDMPPDSKIKIIKKVVPVHTKSSFTPAQSVIARIWKKDTKAAKEALSRVIKRITIIKRLTIIRQVNDDIEKVADEKQPDNSNTISFKKLVKIFNLCHLFVPIIQLKPNNSTHLSLDIQDLRELTTSKEKYKRFVDLQTESLELMVEGFKLPDTVSAMLYLISRNIIEQNQYFLKPFEIAALLTECWHSHLELRQLTLRNAFFDKLKQEYSGLVRPQLETYLYECLGIDHVNESHRVMMQLMIAKLKAKTGHASVINKAFQSEHKVIYKFKDIEDTVVKGLASDSLMRRIDNTEVMKTIDQLALKAKELKPLSRKKQRDSSPHASPKKAKMTK